MRQRTSKYSDEMKAIAYTQWAVNNQNIKKTAVETGIPAATIRSWRDSDFWLDETREVEYANLVTDEVNVFAARAENLRDQVIKRMEQLLPETEVKNFRDLATTVAILTDKARIARGLSTSNQQVQHALPTAEEIEKSLSKFVETMQKATAIRIDDIEEVVDVEIEAPKEIPEHSEKGTP